MNCLLGEIESDTSPGRSYPIQYNKIGERQWLSCNCPSFTIGRWNKGKEAYERSCKHTIMAMQLFDRPLMDLGYGAIAMAAMKRSVGILSGETLKVESTAGAAVRRLK